MKHVLTLGLRFECLPRYCDGRCCRGEGPVFLLGTDVLALAKHFGLTAAETLERHCKVEDRWYWRRARPTRYPVIILKKTGAKGEERCSLLLDDGTCSVHGSSKPWQCMIAPFFREAVGSWSAFRWLKKTCPVARARFPRMRLFTAEEIDEYITADGRATADWRSAMHSHRNDYTEYIEGLNDEAKPT
jgi:Fe-S-cluster containining protein